MTTRDVLRGLLVFGLLVLFGAGLCLWLSGAESHFPQWARALMVLVTLVLMVVVLGAGHD